MITLDQLLASSETPDINALRELWLAFPAELLPAITAAQEDQTMHRVEPLPLTDGRAALCADLLTEIGPGGLFALQFSRLDANLFNLVEVLDASAFQSLVFPEVDS